MPGAIQLSLCFLGLEFRYDLVDFARQALELNFSTQKNLFQQQATQNNASVTLNASGCSICLAR